VAARFFVFPFFCHSLFAILWKKGQKNEGQKNGKGAIVDLK
jgi:hypothetical protein